MKVVKRIIKCIGFILLIGLVVLLIDYLRINVFYLINEKSYINDFSVYGNKNNYVPQGLTYSSLYNVVLQTSYNSKHKVSMLYVIDFKEKRLIKSLELKDQDNNPNTHHVGGIATDNNKVWITNDYIVEEYSLEDIMNTTNNYIMSIRKESLPIRGDFCTYHDNILWIGDFFLKPFYDVPNSDPLLLSYNPTSTDYNSPSLAISLPKMVQGLTFDNDNNFIFTESFTYLINSNFSIYKNIINESSKEAIKINDKEIPHYSFNKDNLIKNIKMPPMAEGLFYKDGYYYILFESSTDSYPLALPKMNKVIKYKEKA